MLLASVVAISLSGPALASDGGSAAKACPYDLDVTIELGRTSLTIPQQALQTEGVGVDVQGYELRPDPSRLVLELVGRRGDVWQVPMTKLVQGKRCQGIFLGRPVQVAAHED